MTDSAVLASNSNTLRIIWRLGLGVKRRSALRSSIVMVVLKDVSLCIELKQYPSLHESRHIRDRSIR